MGILIIQLNKYHSNSDTMLKFLAYRLGLAAGGNPLTFLFAGLMMLTFCLLGLVNIQLTDDP